MPRPADGYYLDGERIPSVTTVLRYLKPADALMAWAWKEGKEGRDYRKTRDQAASAGTLAHRAVEAFLHMETWTWPDAEPEVLDKAKRACDAFQEWAQQTQLRVTHTELSLVSPTHRYGGTMDAVLIQGKRSIGDWKATSGIYPEMLVQVAAYGHLWNENHPEEPVEGGYHLLRFDKDHGDFRHFWWGDLADAWQAFLHCRALYDLEKLLRARAK